MDTTLTPQQLYERGTALLRRGKQKQAIEALEPAHAQLPDDFDVTFNLSAAYIQDKKFKQAVALLEPLRETQGDNENLWVNLGAAYLGNPVTADDERQFNAIVAFSRALQINPQAHSVAYNLGLIHKDRKEFDIAIKWFAIARRTNPNDEDAQYWIDRIMEESLKDEEKDEG